MGESTTEHKSTKSLQLARHLAERGKRLFTLNVARQINEDEGLEIKDVKQALLILKSQGWIHAVKRDLYFLDSVFIGSHPIHEFEIATHLVSPSAISHYSAFYYHKLTDQIPQIVFVTSPTGSSLPRTKDGDLFTYNGVRYCFSQIKKLHIIGIEKVWIGEVLIPMTDLERTLLDGLIKPKYCGGFMEVLNAFINYEKYDVEKIINYSRQLDRSVAKRLGWVLEHVGVKDSRLQLLLTIPYRGFIQLDPSSKKSGKYNKRWHILENI